MEEEDAVSNINFVSCVAFIQQGVSKAHPDKITLTTEELARVISETKNEIEECADTEEERADGEAMDTGDENQQPQSRRIAEDEFNFANYDNEDNTSFLRIGDIAVLDPNEDLADEDNDSEAEDDEIKPNDNLILVGHVDDDSVCMEVYVWNENEGSLYVHHDFLLPSYPLCIEWLNHDPGSEENGNLCAIGSMDSVITVWDLDIQDSLEPAFKLGSKGNRKKKIPKLGHTDAVLDLSWNKEYAHVLASASVDKTVILWDIDEGKPHTTITAFEEKVQCVKFHPTEPHNVLTGVCDGSVRLFDCRDSNSMNTNYKLWQTDGEVEKLIWDNSNDQNYFFVGSQSGKMYYFDRRMETNPVWMKFAHEQEISGLALNKSASKMLTSVSSDGMLKVWSYDSVGARMIQQDDMKIGRIHSMNCSPESPHLIALGGDNKKRQFRVVNLWEYDAVRKTFTDIDEL